MNPLLLASLIQDVAIPELLRWLKDRHASGQPLTDADVIAKLLSDTDLGIKIGEQWLAAHP